MSFSQTVRIIKVHKDNKENQSLRKVSKEQGNSDDIKGGKRTRLCLKIQQSTHKIKQI